MFLIRKKKRIEITLFIYGKNGKFCYCLRRPKVLSVTAPFTHAQMMDLVPIYNHKNQCGVQCHFNTLGDKVATKPAFF